jgi:type IV secretion system protein VirD4
MNKSKNYQDDDSIDKNIKDFSYNSNMELFALIFILLILIPVMNNLFRQFGINFLNPLSWILSFLTKPPLKDDGMMNKQDEIKTFSRFNDGLLIDGKNKRLSAKESFNHLALFSRTGGGKTTSFVLPNIYKLAKQECSMVITDLSGEIFDKTSSYLNSQGFKIYVLDPDNLDESVRYNPLEYATNSINIDRTCEILIASSGIKGDKAEDRMWSNGAKTLISIIIKVLNATEDKRFMNLANVRYLLNNFLKLDDDKKPIIDEFFKRYADDKTFNEFTGFVNGNQKTLQGFISTANIALSPIGINDNLEKLTYSNTIDFKKLREEKSVIYIKIEQQHQEQYSFLLNLFYSQLFNEMMNKIPSKKDLDLYCLLDEFGNMQIPKFSSTITTIRKYRVSISIILQNINQLIDKYSRNEAKTILEGGIANKLIYSGVDLDLGSQLEKMFGYKETLKRQADGREYYDKEPVMNLSEMRTMKDNESLFVYANKKPLKLITKPYYQDMMYNSFSKLPAYKNKTLNHNDNIEYVDLENIEW